MKHFCSPSLIIYIDNLEDVKKKSAINIKPLRRNDKHLVYISLLFFSYIYIFYENVMNFTYCFIIFFKRVNKTKIFWHVL